MQASHVILKVSNLDDAILEYQQKGFAVEAGHSRNPTNALIYFSQGPYLELLDGSHIPGFVKKLMRWFGLGKFVEVVDRWDTCPPGLCTLVLEKEYGENLNKEVDILKRHGHNCFIRSGGRKDAKGRDLKWTVGFTDDTQLPLLMTYFNIDPKPKNFTHPNGITGITGVRFGTREDLIGLVKALSDDPMLKIEVGEGIGIELSDGSQLGQVQRRG